MTDYVFQTKPFEHQMTGFMQSRDLEYFALLMEQGTGKTKLTIDTAAWLYLNGKISAMFIVAPNGVNRNWVIEEVPIHMPDYIHYEAAWYASQPKKSEKAQLEKTLGEKNALKIVAMNIEAIATQKGAAFLENFLNTYSTMLVIDESSVIKNPKAIRTKKLLKLSKKAEYRRILTGTPVTQGPLDIYTQFAFLDPTILRTSSFYAFRSRYAIMREMRTSGRAFMNVVGYRNLDELTDMIQPHSFRVTKSECLDLPEKLYQKRYVQLSKNQLKIYNDLKKDMMTEFSGELMTAPMALTKLMRMQQVVGGFFKSDDIEEPIAIDTTNARVKELVSILEESGAKTIIWARFKSEIYAIVKALSEVFGKDSFVEYHGDVDRQQRSDNIKRFQNDETARFFVGNVQAGGKGLTLHAATCMIYFSNNFSLEDRLQSEDRAHRIGQKHNVTYIDLIAQGTLDEKIVQTLRSKKSVADLITGDNCDISSWL